MKRKIILISGLILVLIISTLIVTYFLNAKNKQDYNPTNDTSSQKEEDKNENKIESTTSSNNEKQEEKDSTNQSTNNTQTTNDNTNSTTSSQNVTNGTNSGTKSNNSTQNSTNSTTQAQNTPTQVPTPSCTPKKFAWSWVRADFTSEVDCETMGNKYMGTYGYSCDNFQDDCGTTYYMLDLFDTNGNHYDYHTITP
jgi:cytoskeletal protein RodZ